MWSWRPCWSCNMDRLNNCLFSQPLEATCEIWLQLAQWFQRRSCLKVWTDNGRTTTDDQGSYASGKCQGNLKFFKVRELSGKFIICQGKLNVC